MSRITRGQSLLKLLLLAVPLTAIGFGVHFLFREMRFSNLCLSNLRALYRALELYEMDRGTLPKLAYFPDIPTEDTDSLRVVLESFGATGSACLCPASAPGVQELGLTYVWNVRLNGKKIPRGDERDWMLVEINALSGDVPAPHLGWYHVLYTDGTVDRVRKPRSQLNGL